MYGLIGRIKAQPGKRDELAALMAGEMPPMEGCLSYVVATDTEDEDGIWVTEVWVSADAHTASLSIPAVGELIGKARPLIAGFDQRFETQPFGGIGI